jgi:hypothetical protein
MDPKIARRILHSTVASSVRSDDPTKARARKAQTALRDDREHPDRCFVYNGFLNLVHRGVAPTETNIFEESRKIAAANEAHFAAQTNRRGEKAEAA